MNQVQETFITGELLQSNIHKLPGSTLALFHGLIGLINKGISAFG